ncbi:MAG TPA: CGNR zinc finger domain-containing protein [Actinomycetes bacterium]|nr:CGNR zinc finger domain-containing protein [Actinomycetes bacterium]
METTAGEETVPRELVAVQALVNTIDLEDNDDQLDSPEALRRFLSGHGLLGASEPVGQADLALAVELREALRAMLRFNHGEPLDLAALEVVNRSAAELPLQVGFDDQGHPVLGPGAGGCRGALAVLLAGVAQASAQGTWERLKACSADSCQWAFYDRSKNRSGRWCSMRTCGNRTKTRTYRSRRRGEPGTEGEG